MLNNTSTSKEVNNVDTLRIQEINNSKSNQVIIEKDATILKNKGDHDDSSNCIRETNEEIANQHMVLNV